MIYFAGDTMVYFITVNFLFLLGEIGKLSPNFTAKEYVI